MIQFWLILYLSAQISHKDNSRPCLVRHRFNDSWTRGFELATHGFEHATRGFVLLARRFELITYGFKLVTRRFELVTRGFELVTRGFHCVTRKVELVTCEFELVDLSLHSWIWTRTFEFQLVLLNFQLATNKS